MRPEDTIQVSIVEWLNVVVPEPPKGPWWTAVNPCPYSSIGVARKAKRMGLKAGAADLIFLWNGKLLCADVKPKGKYLSKDQKEARAQIRELGGAYEIVRSIDDMRMFLMGYGVPMLEAIRSDVNVQAGGFTWVDAEYDVKRKR